MIAAFDLHDRRAIELAGVCELLLRPLAMQAKSSNVAREGGKLFVVDARRHRESVCTSRASSKLTIVHLPTRDDPGQSARMGAGFPDDATIKDLERRLTTFFSHRVPRSTDVRDLVADVIITLPNYRGESSLKTYVFTVARHRVADLHRSRYRRATEAMPSDDHLVVPQTGPSTILDRARLSAALRSEADAMEDPYGEVVRLRLDGLEPREIAERTGVHYHTVRSRLGRGLERLRERMGLLGVGSRSA